MSSWSNSIPRHPEDPLIDFQMENPSEPSLGITLAAIGVRGGLEFVSGPSVSLRK